MLLRLLWYSGHGACGLSEEPLGIAGGHFQAVRFPEATSYYSLDTPNPPRVVGLLEYLTTTKGATLGQKFGDQAPGTPPRPLLPIDRGGNIQQFKQSAVRAKFH